MRVKIPLIVLILVVLITSCSPNNKISLDYAKIVPKISTKAQTNWEIIPKKDYQKPNITEIVNINTPLKEWLPNVFGGSDKLEKKWELAFEHNESERPCRVTGMPNGWSVLSSHHYKGRFMVGVIDPATSLFTKKSYGQGITDGEFEFIDNSFGPNSAYCRRLSDDKKMWDNLSSNQNAGQVEYFIINGALVYVGLSYQDNPKFQYAIVIYRVNPTNGEIIWGIKSRPTFKELFTYHFVQCFSIDKYLWVSLEESTRKSDSSDEEFEDRTYLYKVDVETGDTSKIDVKCNLNNSFMTEYGGQLFIKTENGELNVFDTKTYSVKSYNIGASLKNKNLIYKKFNLHSIIQDKIFYTYFNSKNNSYSMYYSSIDNPMYIQPVIINNSSEFKTISILNKTLYCFQNNKLVGLDSLSLESTWEINLENTDEHTELAWLDWRGVLIVHKDRFECYGVP